jgi:hypothetical protein
MIQDKAMLANLTIRAWSARKRDKSVGQEIEQAHQATDAGNFNKLLIDKVALKDIVSAVTKLREAHYDMTLPWGDNGDRLLPSKMYFDYTAKMRELRGIFDSAADTFEAAYPAAIAAARTRLGTLYNPQDYPDVSCVREKFFAKPAFSPVPDATDFRVDLGADEVAQIREDIDKEMAARHEGAVKDLWSRLHDVVAKIHERLSTDAVFRDSLIENAQFACSMAHKLNLDDDQGLETMQQEIEDRLCRIHPKRLRDDDVLRKQVAESAANILGKFPAWMKP